MEPRVASVSARTLSHHLGCGTRSPRFTFAQYATDSPVARDIALAEIPCRPGTTSRSNTVRSTGSGCSASHASSAARCSRLVARRRSLASSDDLDDRGLDRIGDTWRSGDGAPDVILEIEGNAASFSYNPTGGCS